MSVPNSTFAEMQLDKQIQRLFSGFKKLEAVFGLRGLLMQVISIIQQFK